MADFVRKKNKKNTKLTDEIIVQIQVKYSQGDSFQEIADDLFLKKNTIEKAISQNRIKLIAPEPLEENSYAQTFDKNKVVDVYRLRG